MAVYMISYDLKAPTNNREKVEKSIQALGSWCKYVSTTYLVKSSLSVYEVQTAVTKYLDGNDYMIIGKVEKPICGCLSQEQWNWIHQNL